MSRTFRRKNYEDTQGTSWDRQGRKTNGYYSTYDGLYYKPGGGCAMKVYRPMDKRERFHAWYYAHGESRTRSARSPNRWHRQMRNKENRSIDKKELIQWFKSGGEHEPMCEANPRSCQWDWS
jgi:hypothetical protein